MTSFKSPDPTNVPGELELTFTPVAVVVFELVTHDNSRAQRPTVVGWAWGRVTPGVAGFDDITYTPVGGGTPMDRPEHAALGQHLFTY